MIDRQAETTAEQVAKRLGLDSTFIEEDPVHGWKISRFISNCRLLDAHDDAQLARAMQLARTLHAEPITLQRRFDYLTEGLHYEELLLEKGPIEVPGYQELRAQATEVKKGIRDNE